MTEQKYIEELTTRWPNGGENKEPTKETIALINSAVIDCPNSEKLWIMRGDLYQLINFEDDTPVEESLECYKRAIEINPRSYEAYFEMASFIDAVLAKPRKAKQYFDKARCLKNA